MNHIAQNKMKFKSKFFILVTLLLVGCVTPVAPVLNRDSDELMNEIVSISNFEDVQLNWTTHDGNPPVNLLELFLTNGKNIPTDESEARKIGLKAMRLVVSSIDNADQYQHLVVHFIKSTGTSSMEFSDTIYFFEFTLEELRSESSQPVL